MEAQEMGETSEEETREGTEDGASMKNSRKRSPKGAKNTKAPMDAECGICKSGKSCSCKAKKDGGCGSYGKRGDALTPQEYLAACDLGIQDRSRTYIRARLDTAMNLTPSTVRADLKCGNGSISQGEKCTKGTAQTVDPRATAKREFNDIHRNRKAHAAFHNAKANRKGIGNKVKLAGEVAARVGAQVALGVGTNQVVKGIMSGNIGEASRGFRNMHLGQAAVQMANAGKASRMGNKGLAKEFIKSAGRNAGVGVGQEAAIGAYAGFKRTGGMAGINRRTRSAYQSARARATGMRSTPHGTGWASSAYDRPLPGRRDSVYAAGFSPDYEQLAI